MNTDPRVSIVIINKNYGRFLEGCIESAISQTYPCKIGIVDDNSTDNSLEIIDKYENRLSYCYKNKKDSFGPSKARNYIIRELWDHTDIFAILDADDEMMSNKVEELIKPIIKNPGEVGISYGDYIIEDVETGNRVAEYKYPYSRYELFKHCLIHSGSLISKEALNSIKNNNQFYPEHMRTCEDYMIWIKITRKLIAVHTPKLLSLVRVHKQNSTSSVQKEIWNRNWELVRQEMMNG